MQLSRKHGSYRKWIAGGLLVAGVMAMLSNLANADDSRSVRFQHLSREQGLSQSFVYAIVQDRQGFMWFGTQEGLNRYDGFEFTVFAHDPENPESISDDSVRTIIEDRSGTLWIGTDAGGLSRYDSARQSFTNYLHDPADPSSIADNRVRVIYEDSAGSLWIGTDGSGLDRFDPGNETFEQFRTDPSMPGSLVGNHVWDIIEDSEGSLWIATDTGLSRFDASKNSFTNFLHDPENDSSISDNQLRVVFEDSDNKLWIGTASGGLNRLDRKTGRFERFTHDPADASSISANRIHSILQDNAGVLWIGTVKGLNAWNPATQSFDRYFHNPNDRYSIAQDSVLSIFQDRGNLLWVGTYDGLSLWNQSTRAMLHYKNGEDDPGSLSSNMVTSFSEASSGNIWIGTYGGGLNLLDSESDLFRHIKNQPADGTSLSSNRVMAVHVDRDNVLWVGTRDAGLNRYDSQSGKFTRYRHNPDDVASLSADGVSYILEDGNDGLWIATFGGGLNYFDRDTQSFRQFRNVPDDPTTLSSDRVLILFVDAQQNLWVGTYGGGLNRYDPVTDTFARFTADPDRTDGLSGNEITVIQEDVHGDLWIGVKGGGLHRWRHADREIGNVSFQRFTERDGLPSNTLYSALWDEAGFMWLSSSRGLSRLDIGSLEVRNFNTSHGLQGDEFNLAAGFRATNGQLFFGGMNGFNAFQADQLFAGGRPPQVTITRFLGLNQPLELGDSRSTGEPVILDYEQRVIGFEFAALDYASPSNNRFMYRLDGLDADWFDAGTKRHVSYANLPAGNYTFRVRAMNHDGVWSEQDAILDFRMQPAPWRTWWAYALYLWIVAALILFAFRSHARRTRQAAAIQHAEELGVIQARLNEAQRIANVGNWEWNIVTNELWWSDEIYRLFQVDDRSIQLTYDVFLSHVHPDDRNTVHRAVLRALNERRPYSIEHRILQRDGTECAVHERGEVTFDQQGQAVKMVGTVQDITERKQAEEKIRRRADFEELLAKLSTDFVRAQADDIEQQLKDGLHLVGMTYELDAITIRWQADNNDDWPLYYRWTRQEGGNPEEQVTRTTYPWSSEQLMEGEAVVVDDVAQMPSLSSIDKRSLTKRGIRSFVSVPILIDEERAASVAFSMSTEKRSWSAETVKEFTLIAENLAGAIARTKATAKIRELTNQLQEENFYLRQEVSLANVFEEIVGGDTELRKCLQAVEKVAPTDVAVLVQGETGTGKELFARAIHKLSARRDQPMVSVNCPALPATLFESELFGHEKGSFTGAESQRLGRFELADGGTLFLDEIGELPLEVQSKLLRVLQTGEFDRLGGTITRHSNVRLIAATNRDLKQAVEVGEFRADLYYRIGSFPIKLPALRDRKGDIPMLAEHFVRKHGKRLGKTIDAISARMIRELVDYEWPGNVRELESIVERALISADDAAVLELPAPLRLMGVLSQSKSDFAPDEGADLRSIERSQILQVLDKVDWRISGPNGAAALLGIPASTLRSKMKRLGISRQ